MFLSRCLIYKVHALAFRPAVLFILAHSFELVKYFFRSFSTSCRSTLIQALVHVSLNSFILPHSFESVKNFFQGFSRFSCRSASISSSFLNRSASHANSSILTRASRFVKHFFQKSFGSPSRFPSVFSAVSSVFMPSREVLSYYISLFSLCQHSFSNFFDFLERSS